MSANDTGPLGRIEEDLEQPVKAVTRTHRGMFAGAPLGLVAVMVLASVAFGASVVTAVISPAPKPTAAIVAGADPTDIQPSATTAESAPTTTANRPTSGVGSGRVPPTTPTLPATPTPPAAVAPNSGIVDLGQLVVADNLDLSVSFGWTAYTGDGLIAYVLVSENTSSGLIPSYPGSAAWGTAASGKTSLTLHTIPAGDYQVRLQALCGPSAALAVCGQTGVAHVHLSANRGSTPNPPTPAPTAVRTAPRATPIPPTQAPPSTAVVDMGALTVADNLDRTISFAWHPYTGSDLTGYAVFAEDYASGKTPTYPVSTAWHSAPSTKTSIAVGGIPAGTYNVRVQALCGTGSGLHVCGQTAVVRIHLSAAVYGSPTPAATPAQ